MDDDIIILQESRPTRSDAVKNRALLLETAQRLFAERGVDHVSMSAVAEAAGVGKGTLYRHFTSKSELCLALLDHDQRDLQERTFARLRQGGDPRTDLAWFLGEVLAFIDRHGQWLYAGALTEGMTSLEHPAHLWWRQTIRSLLERAAYRGDLDYAADLFYVMVNVHTVEFQRHALGYTLERIEQGALDLLNRLLS